MKDNGSVYECVKEFLCDECDDDGNELEEEFRIVKKGSRWIVEWTVNGWARLCEMSDGTISSYLEIPTEYLFTNFRCIK